MKSERQIMLHSEANLLLPWYANGTLSEREHQEVKQHLAVCQACRSELELFGAIQHSFEEDKVCASPAQVNVERLLGKLEAREAERTRSGRAAVSRWADWKSLFGRWTFSSPAWSVAVPALLLVAMVGGVWRMALPPHEDAAAYRTLSSDDKVAASPLRIRIVTDPALSKSDMQALVSGTGIDSQLVVVGQGYYHLLLSRQRPPAEVMSLLHALQSSADVQAADLISD